MSFSRHTIRIGAFQTLFALINNPLADKSTLYAEVLNLTPNEAAPQYLDQLVTGVQDHQEELDAIISSYLTNNWTIDRVARTNLVILRIALYELQYEKELPAPIVINEALELAKSFSDNKSRRFINGVLGHYEQEHD
ncbi:transcription antitermination factor NusB [uncultured Limosilactobacillus sp.]|uniref:transcription antitermination factor NusB n=1 Tax=uncultured Limosilactobacillus sp. TaxID=2837629 RepID=UPI0025FB0822|nr:transcription antitermination factor NusB [uncultured Limosilactobacillus sp.]